MARQKKDLSLQIEAKQEEAIMTEEKTTEVVEETQENAGLEITLESIQKEIDEARLELEQTKAALEEKKHELKHIPRREVEEYEQKIIEKQVNNINKKKNRADIIEKQRIYDSQMITGRFMNRRAPGQQVKLPYCKHATDNPKWWIFKDGVTYTIPRGFADQINEYYHTPVFVQKDGPQNLTETVGENSQIASVDTSNKKYAFVPCAFAA